MTGQKKLRRPVEKKVKAATGVTYLVVAVGLALVELLSDDPSLVGFLPPWLQPILLALLPAAGAFLSGWQAHHTPRPDLPVSPPPDA